MFHVVAADLAGRGLAQVGLTPCRAWARACAGLEGETNVQGRLAEADGTVFRHVELSRTVRDGDRALVGNALVKARIGLP